MRIIESFKGWLGSEYLNENISAAKAYMLKLYADRLEIPQTELTPQQKTEALQDRAYKRILELVSAMPGYAFAFVRFHFEQGARIADLQSLLNIIKTEKHVIQQLPKQIDQYANQEEANGVNGFEALMDDIRTIKRNKEAKWLIDRLPRGLRDAYRALPSEDQKVMINAAHQLTELGQEAISRLLTKIASMSTWSIQDVIDYITNYLEGFSNLQLKSKIDEITELEPEAGIIYQDDQYLAISVRTENSQKKLCAVANWCINRGSFTTYASDAVQLNIFNFGIPPTDPMFLVGTTIRYSGETRTTHDINDKYIQSSSNTQDNLTSLGYPAKMVNSILAALPTEMAIKKIVYSLNIDSQANTPDKLLKTIIVSDYATRLDSNDIAQNVVAKIVDDRIEGALSVEQVSKFFVEYGILSKFAAKLFKRLMADASPEEKAPAIQGTLNKFKFIREALQRRPDLSNEKTRNVLEQEKEVYDELGIASKSVDEMLLEFYAAEPAVKPAPVKTPAPTKPAPSRPGPVPTKQPFKQPEPAKAEAEDVLKRYFTILDEKPNSIS